MTNAEIAVKKILESHDIDPEYSQLRDLQSVMIEAYNMGAVEGSVDSYVLSEAYEFMVFCRLNNDS